MSDKRLSMSQRVLKVMALFTGMQFFTIFCSIVKMKLVSLWLAADGVGLFGILNTTMETTSTLTDMGLRQSAVRDIAQSASTPRQLARTAALVRRWSAITGMLGAIVVSALCLPLSIWFFGNGARWWMFALLSFSMLLNAICGGEQALLQGSGRLKALLRVNVWGAAGGLLLSVPLFRWCGLTSVIWSAILYSACGLGAALVLRLHTEGRYRPDSSALWNEGKSFMRLGMWMAVAAFVTNMSQMAFMAILSGYSSLAEVGYYQGGVTLIVRYMGLIFTAMSMEYYPRLAANAFSRRRLQLFVNHEARVLLTVLIPVIVLFLLLRRWIVLVLYQPEFEAMIAFMSRGILSCVFKATSWCMAFVMLARGDGKSYIITESIDAALGLALCTIGYRYYGLAGIGMAYILWYLSYTLMVGWIYRYRYGLRLHAGVKTLTLICFATGCAMLCAMHYLPYGACCVLAAAAVGSSMPALSRLWRRRRPSTHP